MTFEPTIATLIALPTIGLVAGAVGGLLGIGGGLVMIPAMLLILGEPFGVGTLHIYKLAALIVAALLSIPAAIRHGRAGAIQYRVLPAILIGGVVGVVVGVLAAAAFSGEATVTLKRVFGAFLIVSVIFSALERRYRSTSAPDAGGAAKSPPASAGRYGAIVGFPAGGVSGLLGIGGGVWATPAQHLFLRTPLRNAIANSGTMIVALAPAAAVCQALAVARMSDVVVVDALPLAALLAPTAMIGAWIGARLTHVLPLDALRYAFWLLLLIAGGRLLFAA